MNVEIWFPCVVVYLFYKRNRYTFNILMINIKYYENLMCIISFLITKYDRLRLIIYDKYYISKVYKIVGDLKLK